MRAIEGTFCITHGTPGMKSSSFVITQAGKTREMVSKESFLGMMREQVKSRTPFHESENNS